MNFKRGKLDNDQLIHFYRSLLLPRMIEDKMLVLLRQGKIGKWFSGIGQEAISVGATLAMEKNEWILPLHRNLGVFTSRNMPLANLFNQITPQNDSEFYVYELLNAVPDYFIIVLGISLVLTILISFLSAIYVMFNRKSNSYLFMLLFFMWFVFLGFTALSIPGIIIEMQDLDLLPNWIDGSYSLMYKWD